MKSGKFLNYNADVLSRLKRLNPFEVREVSKLDYLKDGGNGNGLNPFEVREVSKRKSNQAIQGLRSVLIPLKSGKFLNRKAAIDKARSKS